MKRITTAVLTLLATACATLGTVAANPTPASAAVAAVPNGITTTDLAAVGASPAALAQALVGTGVTVSNVTFTGSPAQAGTIHIADPAVVSFNDGIIMSSGNVADIVGPNKSESTTGDMGGTNDPQLDALIAGTQTVNPTTFDAAALEFDFVPSASTVYFTYTFGSDEYLEWVNLYNDVFAFFVNGQNCATTPAGQAVSIDTINSTVNPTLYRDNSFANPPANPITIEPDGLSVELICTASVTPGQTNHMRLAIADTSDQILDSVVMIKAGSLGTIKPESCNDGVDNNDDTLVDDGDPICQTTTTPPAPGQSGIGSGSTTPPFTGNEGSPVTLDASVFGWTAAPEAIDARWTVTGINGTSGSCSVDPAGPIALNPDHSIPVVQATCPDDGEYVARVEGFDAEGHSAFDDDVDFFVQNAPPSVSVDAPAGPLAPSVAPAGPPTLTATAGQPFSVTATVADLGAADTATCAIAWGDGSSDPGTMTAGQCSASHTYAAAGDVILAVTATDGAGATGAAAALVTVSAPSGPSVTVTPSTASPVTGEPVTFTAAVAEPSTVTPHGKVVFLDGATVLATRTVSAGAAIFRTTRLSLGAHSIVARWLPSATATPIESSALDLSVGKPATTVTVAATPASTLATKPITIRARVQVVKPGKGHVVPGTVTFFDGSTPIGSVALATGTARLQIFLPAGTHEISAGYEGSDSLLASPQSNVAVVTTT